MHAYRRRKYVFKSPQNEQRVMKARYKTPIESKIIYDALFGLSNKT